MKVFRAVVSAVGAACLVFVLFAAGFFPCAAPITTQVLSQGASNYETSPYALDDLNTLAVASRDYTVDPRGDASEAQARATFNTALMKAAQHSSKRYTGVSKKGLDEAGLAKYTQWTDLLDALGEKSAEKAFGKEDVNEVAVQMAAAGDRYALDEDAFSHLDDCNTLINSIVPLVGIAGIVALVCLIALAIARQWKAAGRMLTIAPLILIVSFAFMGTWAFIDFYGFFSAFHGVFFPQGNWTFSYESLLICMYPTAFWMGMGALWLATTLVASIMVLAVGRKFAHIGE